MEFADINWMGIILALFLIFVGVTLYLTQMKHDPFDLRYLIIDETGQPSLHKTGQLFALFVSTWGFVYLTVHDKLSETYFGVYMTTWAATTIANKWIDSKSRVDNTKADATAEAVTTVADSLTTKD